jgi:hypothetical protein
MVLYMQPNAVIETTRRDQQLLWVVCALLGQASSAVLRTSRGRGKLRIWPVFTKSPLAMASVIDGL